MNERVKLDSSDLRHFHLRQLAFSLETNLAGRDGSVKRQKAYNYSPTSLMINPPRAPKVASHSDGKESFSRKEGLK